MNYNRAIIKMLNIHCIFSNCLIIVIEFNHFVAGSIACAIFVEFIEATTFVEATAFVEAALVKTTSVAVFIEATFIETAASGAALLKTARISLTLWTLI